MKALTRAALARCLEHMCFRPEATRRETEQWCATARELGLHGVCVNGSRVELAYSVLEPTEVKVIGLVGFPFGAADADVKRYETEVAIDHGAHEIDLVLNIGRLKDGDAKYVLREMRDIAEAAEERPVKVTLEMGLLTGEEASVACELALDSGVQFVCATTGFGAPATPEMVRFLRARVGEKFGVKVAGDIDTLETAVTLIEAGATRLGTSHSAALLNALPQ